MCECGCIEMGKRWELPGPEGTRYIVHKYPGCKNCSTPCGVSIQKIYKKEYNLVERFLELQFVENEIGKRSIEMGFFSQEELQDKLRKYLEKYFEDAYDHGYQMRGEKFDEIDADIASEEFAEEFFNER